MRSHCRWRIAAASSNGCTIASTRPVKFCSATLPIGVSPPKAGETPIGKVAEQNFTGLVDAIVQPFELAAAILQRQCERIQLCFHAPGSLCCAFEVADDANGVACGRYGRQRGRDDDRK